MNFDSIEKIFLICIFIFPGFIVDCIASKILYIKGKSEVLHMIYSFLYSLFHFSTFYYFYTIIWRLRENYVV